MRHGPGSPKVFGNTVNPRVIYIHSTEMGPVILSDEAKEYTMVIGNGYDIITDEELMTAMMGKNPESIVVHAHGKLVDEKHYMKGIGGERVPTSEFFQKITTCVGAGSTANIIVRACHGGAALDDAAFLPPNTTLFTVAKRDDVNFESVISTKRVTTALGDADSQKFFLLTQHPYGFGYSQGGKIFISEPPTAVSYKADMKKHIAAECDRMEIPHGEISDAALAQYGGNLFREHAGLYPEGHMAPQGFFQSVVSFKGLTFPLDTELEESGMTPLMFAASQNNVHAMNALYFGGANLNAVNSEGRTALSYAIKTNSIHAVRRLLEDKADPRIAVRRPLEDKADPRIADNQGTTPLMLACMWGRDELVDELLKSPQ